MPHVHVLALFFTPPPLLRIRFDVQRLFTYSQAGDSRLDLPLPNKVQKEDQEVDGRMYTYIFFNSNVITRSLLPTRRP